MFNGKNGGVDRTTKERNFTYSIKNWETLDDIKKLTKLRA